METIYLVYTPVAARVGEDDNSPFKIIGTLEEAKVILEGNYKLQDPDKVIKVIKVKDYDESNPESGIMSFIGLRDKDFSISSSQIGSQSEEGVYDRSLDIPVKDLVVDQYYMHEGTFKKLIGIKPNDDHPNPTYTLRFEDGRVARLQPNDTLRLEPSQSAGKRVSRSKRKTPLNKRSRKTRNGLIVKMEK